MAGTHEENLNDPAWLTEQMTRYKAALAELQGKHDAQLKGIEEDKKTIASLNGALAEAGLKANGYEEAIATLKGSIDQMTAAGQKLSEEAAGLRVRLAEKANEVAGALALAKARRTALSDVMKVVAPVLVAE